MKKRHSLSFVLPRLVMAMGLMLAGGIATASAAPSPEPQQSNQTARVIKGTVFDENDEPAIGASVTIKGGEGGAATDIDGNFAIRTTKPNVVLVISYVGYKNKEVAVHGDAPLKITLEPASEVLEEVVVTALGIKRQTKALGYSVQDLKGNAITEARENNVINSLSGRIAGLQVSSSGNGSMGSSRITIRGNNSLTGSNQPLIVVDGVPMSNSNGGSGLKVNENSGDTGNGLADINPDDIENISVLKGAAAAALYGTRAGNGVLMITTKKGGDRKGLGVTWNSNVMIERPLTQPKMQNIYGQGSNGVFTGDNSLSWGPKMEGQLITDWTGQEREFLPYDNNVMDYLQTGVTTTNTLEAGFNADQGSFRATLAYQRIDGVVPSNYQDKYNINLRGTINLTKRLTFDAKVNYIKRTRWNNPSTGGDPASVMRNYLMMPRSIHYSDMSQIYDEDGNVLRWTNDPYYLLNPYAAEINKSESTRDRFVGFLALNYQITDWLSLKIRHGEDFYWNHSDSKVKAAYPVGTSYGNHVGNGHYALSYSYFRERNTDFLIMANKDNWWGSKFSGSLSFGGNMMHRHSDSMSQRSGGLEIPDFFTISNGMNITASNDEENKSVNSLYGLAQLSYGGWVYLDVTGRNDWSSTLPKNRRSFFYPSVGLGLVVSDLIGSYGVTVPRWLSFAKLRASYAEVGNDTSPYQLVNNYVVKNLTADIKQSQVSEVLPLFDLKPEIIKSWEAGFDVRFLNNRLGLDFTWYKKNATNQILTLPIGKTSGYSSRKINAGNIQNAGIEVVLNATPIDTKDFQWTTTINYSRNRNKIIELHPEIKYYSHGSAGFVRVISRAGGTYGDIVGYRYQRDPQTGKKIVDANGLPLLEANIDTENAVGNYLPDWTGSMNNQFRYKDFTLSFLLDLRVGGDIYMRSLAVGGAAGTTEMTIAGRDEWYNGTGGILVDGVVANGDGTYSPNTTYANPQEYWSRVEKATEEFTYDGTNLRLRELTFGYILPKKVLDKTPFTGLKVSFVARNLWMIYNKVKGGYDPESVVSTNNAGGVEYSSFPSMRSFGLNLNVSF